ncbi:MAG: calcium-binding protein [Hyphomonadaceae bacterium]|nr:calcium-binding protein [Hyphomonadaceae bacterium]
MATFSDQTAGIGISNFFGDYFGQFNGANATVDFSGTTQATINLTGSSTGTIVLTGTGLGFTEPSTFNGSVTGFSFTVNGIPLYTVSGLNISLALIALYVGTEDGLGLLAAVYGGNDTFNINDANAGGPGNVLYGMGGNDTFNYGDGWYSGAGTYGVDGGAGSDTLVLDGDYFETIALKLGTQISTSSNLVSVETVQLTAGHDYTILKNGWFGYGRLTIDGSALGVNDVLFVDRPISDQYGYYTILGGAAGDTLVGADSSFADIISGNGGADFLYGEDGNDTLNGGAGNDRIFGGFGNDVVDGGEGNDTIDMSGDADNAKGGAGNDRFLVEIGNVSNGFKIDGGLNVDTMVISGSSVGSVDFTMVNVEVVDINVNGDLILTIGNAMVAAGKTLTIDAVSLNSASEDLTFNGSAELNGKFIVKGGAGSDSITGGGVVDDLRGNGGSDTINGRLGNDVLTGGTGGDFFVFNTALNSSTNVDRIADYNVAADTIQLENAIFKTLAAGALNPNAFWKGGSAHDANDRIIYNATTGALFFDQDGTGATHAAIKFATLSPGLNLTAADFVVI